MTTATFGANGSVGPHWAHQRFVQNLINASRARELGEAAREWELQKIDVFTEEHNCQACNTKILNYALLTNKVNGNCLVIGEDCYDKLVQFLAEGRVESTLPNRKKRTGDLRSHWTHLLKDLKDRTVLGWLRDELAAGRLTGDVASTVYTITRIGFAPTTSDADLVVAYYKATRKFPIAVFFNEGDFISFVHRRLLPQQITIDQAGRISRLLNKNILALERRRRAEVARADQKYWSEQRAQVMALLASFEQDVAKADVSEGDMAILKSDLERTRAAIEAKMPEALTASAQRLETWQVADQAKFIARKWQQRNRWRLHKLETVVFVNEMEDGIRYLLLQSDGRWVERWIFHIYGIKGKLYGSKGIVPQGFSLCSARIIEEVGRTMEILITDKLDSSDKIVEVNFSEPSHQMPGFFVGYHKGKVVLPNEPIDERGSYHVFLMNDTGRYYRGWVL